MRQGRVVVTVAMLEPLDDEERAAVVAHERAISATATAIFW